MGAHEAGAVVDGDGRAMPGGRMEYRIWDPMPCCVERLAAMGTPAGVDERTDVYLVGPDHTVNAKVRDEALEVKRLVGSTWGFQRWRPDPAVELPLTSKQLALLLLDLGITGSDVEGWIDREQIDPREILAGSPTGHVVTVGKRRQRYELGTARAEFTEVEFPGLARSSIAVEAIDPETVRQATERLKLVGENRPMHRAAADAARQT